MKPIILSRNQVRRVDRLAVDRYGMSPLVLMENAGRSASDVIDEAYGPGGNAVVLCGGGNNGGDGCVIARHLLNGGWGVRVVMTAPEEKFTNDTRVNHAILTKMDADQVVAPNAEMQRDVLASIDPAEVVVDALLGTGFTGAVRSPTAELITGLNQATKAGLVAIDVPSGLDCDTGVASRYTIQADVTITFVAVKRGFLNAAAAPFLGRTVVGDIGVPQKLIEEVLASSTGDD